MRRLTVAILLLALVFTGCRSRKKRVRVVEDDGQLVSVINMADPRGAVQLIRGFYAVENDAWRWVAKSFTVTLRPPRDAAQKGARLELQFDYPEVVFNRIGKITIDAKVNGLDLGPEAYSQAGKAVYARDIPAAALSGDAVAIDFSCDKSLVPSDQDARELSLIVTTVGLLPK
jgi:hypothetical protein